MSLNFDSQNTQNVFCDAQKGVKKYILWCTEESRTRWVWLNLLIGLIQCLLSYLILKYYQIGLYVRCSCRRLHLELCGIARYFTSVWLKVRENSPLASSLAPVCPDLCPFAFSKHASLSLSLTQSFAGVSVVEQKQGGLCFLSRVIRLDFVLNDKGFPSNGHTKS